MRLRRALSTTIATVQVAALFGFWSATPALAAGGCATPARDGSPNLAGVVNTYYPATANAAAGATRINVGTATGSGTPIASGDMLLVVQMQNTTIVTTNDASYGAISGTNTSGKQEYAVAASGVVAGQVTLASGLVNSYFETPGGTQPRTFQVIRVPQYSSPTLGSGLTAQPWNGSSGGVLAIDVAGTLNLNGGTATTSSQGFRGGGGMQLNGAAPGGTGTEYRILAPTAAPKGGDGAKGEGVAGTPRFVYDTSQATPVVVDNGFEGYSGGSMARGAPANAGGGGTDPSSGQAQPNGNQENTGGGGGANGGAGGLGGNSWTSNLPEGGIGGAAWAATVVTPVMGGGGGAGSRNNTPTIPYASSGGPGGGIVLIRAGSVSGSGTISADGGTGVTPQNDGGGGGGAGGSVVVLANSGSLGGLTISARGGVGTDANPNDAGTGGAHGPGGGGGGGVVITSSAPASANVAGASNGFTTDVNGLGDATPYGATAGSSGVNSASTIASTTGTNAGALCTASLTILKSGTTAAAPNGLIAYSILVSNTGPGAASGAAFSDTVPTGIAIVGTPSCATTSGGATCGSVTTAAQLVSSTITTLPSGSSVTFTILGKSAASASYTNTATLTPPSNVLNQTPVTSSVTTVVDPSNGVTKTVANITSGGAAVTQNTAVPGDVLEYAISYTNSTGVALASFAMGDTVPANTTFVSASCVTPLPAGVTACTITAPAVGGTGNVSWRYTGSLATGATAGFILRVKVN